MKKHAKKSLLVPILVLASVVAVIVCCYLAQTFAAFAGDGEELSLEPSQPGQVIKGQNPAEEPEQTNPDGAQVTPTGNRLMTRIHFSTGDIMTGSIVNNDDGSSISFWPTDVLAHEFT